MDMAENEGLSPHKGEGRIGISPLAVKGIMLLQQLVERERERDLSCTWLSLKEAEITWAACESKF